jgi:PEGA domain
VRWTGNTILIIIILIMMGCNSPFVTLDFCVETVPPGASIICAGEYLGKTPRTVQVASSSEVTITLPGFEEVVIKPDELLSPRTYRFIDLEKLHEVVFDYRPHGAKVWDGEEIIGETPFSKMMIKGIKELVVKFPHHEDYKDVFLVHGETFRTEELVPLIKYFPETICDITTNPAGASIRSLVVCEGSLMGEFDDWGVTPLSGTNSDIMESRCERFFIFEMEGSYPALLRFRGSINASIELPDSKKFNIPKLPKTGVKDLVYVSGVIEGGGQPFSAVHEGTKFKIFSTKYSKPVSVSDLETKGSKFSGGSWWGGRFFVVRFKGSNDNVKYLLYDSQERKRIKFEDFGLYHERNIPGIIRWNEQIPASNSRVENFIDIRFKESSNGLLFYLKPYAGVECWFVLLCDSNLESSQLVDIMFK